MKKAIPPIRFADLPGDYAGLCRRHLPRPIRDRVDYQNTTEITDTMAGHDLTPDQEDYFDLLGSLIEDYDREHLPRSARKINGLARVLKQALSSTPAGERFRERGSSGS